LLFRLVGMWLVAETSSAQYALSLLGSEYNAWLVYGADSKLVQSMAELGACRGVSACHGLHVSKGYMLANIAEAITRVVPDTAKLMIYDQPWLAAICSELHPQAENLSPTQQTVIIKPSEIGVVPNYQQHTIECGGQDLWRSACKFVEL